MIGLASTIRPAADGIVTIIMALIAFLTVASVSTRSPFAKDDEILGIIAEAMALERAIGRLVMTSALRAYIPYDLATSS